jgi:hypothetical protein
MKTWEEFNTRFQLVRHDLGKDPLDFYGCVNAEGEWFDSSESFDIAVHWCCYYAGQFEVLDEIKWMNTEGRKLKLSVIHGTMLKQMYEKGLIK